ncbi:MAG: serine protease [Gemmataceae bacterium]|nr:serine protease [Gemmataceae bacterium]
MNCRYALLGVFALGALPILGLSPRAKAADDVEAIYAKAVKSCVFIIVPMDKTSYAMGSGSLIDVEKRLILTNYHVVDEKDYALVQFPIYLKSGEMMTDKEKYKDNAFNNKAITGKVLFRDKARDLAIIQLSKLPPGVSALPLAKKSTTTGTMVWNIGSPGAVEQVFSITEGKVRSVGDEKFLVGEGDSVFEVRAKIVTTTNPANPGDSGGPLIDKRGYQVAVTESGDTSAKLVSKFIDVSEVRKLLAEKKLTFKELSDEPDPKAEVTAPKLVVDPKKDIPTKKEIATAPTTTPAQEREATELLRRSKLFSQGEDNRPAYTAKLQEILKKYPGTDAAKEAKKILDNLK